MAIFDRILVAESQLIGLGESLIHTNSIDVGINKSTKKLIHQTPLF